MFDLSSKDLLCVDIDYDMNFFYMKYLDLKAEPELPERDKFFIQKVAHKWRSRISNTLTDKVFNDEWKTVTASKYSKFFQLYAKYLEVSIYYLVAHRNYISTFDMSANNGKGKWVHHFRASDDEHVRDVVLQRRDNGIKVELDEE